MGYNSTEYTQTVTLNLQQAKDALQVQKALIDHGFKGSNAALITAVTGVGLSLLSLIFLLPTAVTFAAGVTSTALGLVPSEKAALEDMAGRGRDSLSDIALLMAGTQFDMVEVVLPKMKFVFNDSSKNWGMVSGKGRVTRMHSISGGWTLA
ncbi:hypothetical protein [Paenibacillus sp. FSL P4-0288]|uniref:hypothetical protein n=1 Tax=Paenibacillus sp. FSL P4-0288 TaxID=2921633 RepID=UPI0030F6E924